MRLGSAMGRLARVAADTLQQELRRRSRRGSQAPRPTRGRSDGRVEVGYAPSRDGDADPGEVAWAWVPFEEDPTQGKDRPVLVLGTVGRHLMAVPLTSRHRPDRGDQVPVGTGSWDSQRRPSYADAGRLLRLDPDGVRREGAALSRDRFEEVLRAVRSRYPELGA